MSDFAKAIRDACSCQHKWLAHSESNYLDPTVTAQGKGRGRRKFKSWLYHAGFTPAPHSAESVSSLHHK